MATDLERLVVQLSADIKGYENALNRAKTQTDRQTKAIENRFRTMNRGLESTFASFGKGFVGGIIGALGVQQLAQVTRQVASLGDAIGDLSEQTGATVESIQILRYAAQQTGSSAEQMDKAIAKLAVNLGEAATGSGDLAELLDANNIALTDATGKARPFNDILNDIIGLVQRAPNQFAALEVVTRAFGMANDELVTTLRNGVTGVDAYGRELRDLGGIIDQDGIDALSRLDAKFNETTAAMQAALQRLVVATGPLIERILDEIAEFAKTLGEISETIELLFKGEFAAAGRLATQGPETEVEKSIRERSELEAQIVAVQEDQKALQGQINVAREMGGLTQDELNAKQKEMDELVMMELQLRQRLATMPRPDLAPTAAPITAPGATTVIPTKIGTDAATEAAKVEGELRQLQATTAAIRKLPLNDELRAALEYAAKLNKLIIEVTSGGQVAKGTPGPRTGSTRHDLGRAADIQIRDPVTGQLLNANNPADLARINSLIETLASAGLTGFGGPGYMGPTKVHVGYGTTATWGGMPTSTQEAINRGMANPAYVAGVEQARLTEAQRTSDQATQAELDRAEIQRQAAEDYEAILASRREALGLAQMEIDLFGQGTRALDEQRILHEEMLRLKELGLEKDADAVAAAQAYASQMAASNARLDTLQTTQELSVERLDEMRGLASDMLGGIVSDLRAGASAGEIFANVLDKLISKLAEMSIEALTAGLFGATGTSQTGLLGGIFGSLFGIPMVTGARQHGGPVMAGSSYMVGEHGPEIFTPSVGGSILPNAGGQRVGVAITSSVAPSPFFIQTISAVTDRKIAANNRTLPSYLADRQRRGI